MATDLEEQKKAILPFMQRAQEIQQADPKVAYYCRLYGVEQALKIPQRAKEINALLGAALTQLEKEKVQLVLDPAADRIHCLGFALRIFDNADRVDRAGKATERTSKAFYAASVFIEILNHWEGGVDGELVEKQRYCAWRAAEIRKALREGRPPVPPPAVEAPPAAGGPAAAGPGGSLDDLPPASGSSDWAYGGSFTAAAASAQPPPPAYGGHVAAFPPPPPPQLPGSSGSSFTGGIAPSAGSFSAGGLASAPPPLGSPPRAVSYPQGAAPAPAAPHADVYGAGLGPRFWPGCRVLVRSGEGLEDSTGATEGETVVGTVGLVVPRPDGGFSYKVALSDRLLELPDGVAVPALQEGDIASLRSPPNPAVPVRVLVINDALWPPSYLVQKPDGREEAVEAHQLAPPPARREGGPPVGAAPPPPPPAMPPQDRALGPDYGYTATSTPAAPPPPPTAPHAAYPHPHLPPSGLAPPPPPPAAPPAVAPSSSPYLSTSHAPPRTAGPAPAAAPAPPPPPQASYAKSYSSPASSAAASAPAPLVVPTLPPGYKPPLQILTEAQKQAKYAVSALSFEDVHTAVKNLTEALRLLTTPGATPAPHGR